MTRYTEIGLSSQITNDASNCKCPVLLLLRRCIIHIRNVRHEYGYALVSGAASAAVQALSIRGVGIRREAGSETDKSTLPDRAVPNRERFKKGHRIRVDISSSHFPHFDVNPNSGEPLGLSRRMMTADNTIYHDTTHPSQVILPIVEKGAMRASAQR
jgi:hypothetical protein